jgi:hypothetical protein
MSNAYILEELQYDSEKKTAVLSASQGYFQTAANALRAALGANAVLNLTSITKDESKENRLQLVAKSDVFGQNRDVWVDVASRNGTLESLWIAIPLPAEGWKPADCFPALKKSNELKNCELINGLAIISYGISAISGITITIANRSLDISGYQLQDGLQFFCDSMDFHVSGVDPVDPFKSRFDSLGAEKQAQLKLNGLSDKKPEKIELRVDQRTGGIELEGWWDNDNRPKNLAKNSVFRSGISCTMNWHDLQTSSEKWLLVLGNPFVPIVLEALVESGVTPRYTLQSGQNITSNTLLGALLGGKADNVFKMLAVPLPTATTLTSLAYLPDTWLSFALGTSSLTPYIIEIGPFSLREIDLSFDVGFGTKTAVQLDVYCRSTFFDQLWEMHYRPNAFVEGRMLNPTEIKLAALIDQIAPIALPVQFEMLTISLARLTRYLSNAAGTGGSVDVAIQLDGRVTLFSDAIVLSRLELQLTVPDKPDGKGIDLGNSSGSFRGVLEIGPVMLAFSALRLASSWTLAAEAHFGSQGVSLTNLLNHLATKVGVAIPEAIPDIQLRSVGIRYDLGSNALQLEGITDWEVEQGVPVLSGKSTVVLRLLVSSTTAGRSAELSLNWRLEKAGAANTSYDIQASLLFSRASQVLGLDLSVPDPATPLTLSQLATDLAIPDLPLPAAEVVDAIFQVSHFSMNYYRPGNGFALAWSRPLGSGLLVAEYEQAAQVLATASPARDRVVKVTWAGNDANATIGLQDVFTLVGAQSTYDGFSALIPQAAADLLTFKELGFQYAGAGKQQSITITAVSTYRGGTNTFVALQRGSAAGVVAGFVFGQEAGSTQSISELLPFSNVDGLQEIIDTVKTVLDHVELTHVLIATNKTKQFQLPAFAPAAAKTTDTQSGALALSRPFGDGSIAIEQGVSVGFRVRFGQHPLLSKFIAISELNAQVSLGMRSIGFRILIPGTLALDVGGGTSLALTQPVLAIQKNGLSTSFQLGGRLDLQLFGVSVDVSGWLDLSLQGVNAHLQITDLALPPIPMMPGVHFQATAEKPMSFLVGLTFQPPAIDLGMQGSFYICTTQKDVHNDGKVGVVLQVLEGAAHPKYLEFGLKSITLMTALEVFTGVNYFAQLAEDANNAAKDVVGGPLSSLNSGVAGGIDIIQGALEHIEAIVSQAELNQVFFHWADTIVYLPDGNVAMPGVGFRGGISFFGWNAYAALSFSLKGIPEFEGHIETEPLEIAGILRIWGNGKGIKKLPEDDLTTIVIDQKPDSGNEPYFLEPGGPVLHVSTSSSPFIVADLHAELFGSLQTDIHAEVTTDGFAFHFGIGAGNIARADLACHWWKDTGKFEAYGALGIHLHGTLGPLIPGVALTEFELDTDLEASIRLSVDKESFYCSIDGAFQFRGVTLDMPELVLQVRFQSLDELAEAVWEHIKDLAEDIFEEFLLPIGEFIGDTAQQVFEIGKDAAEAAVNITTEGAKKAAQALTVPVGLIADAGTDLANAGKALVDLTQKTIEQAPQLAFAATQEIVKQAEAVRKAVEDLATNVASEIAAIGTDIKNITIQAAQFVAQKAQEAIAYVSQKIEAARRWASERIQSAIALANELRRQAEQIVSNIVRQIEALNREIAHYANLIASFFASLASGIVIGAEATFNFVTDPFDSWF